MSVCNPQHLLIITGHRAVPALFGTQERLLYLLPPPVCLKKLKLKLADAATLPLAVQNAASMDAERERPMTSGLGLLAIFRESSHVYTHI